MSPFLADAADIAESARLAYVGADFLAAAQRYGDAAELAPTDARERWQYRLWQGYALSERGLRFGEPGPLHAAVAIYRTQALPLAPRQRAPADWAATQNNLGNALSVLGRRGDEAALQGAIAAFRAALEVRTRAAAPADWATTQNNLGIALQVLGERGDQAALQGAIAAYRAALEVRTRAAAPADWAMTQNNLGLALELRGDRSGSKDDWREAAACYRAALEIWTREHYPAQYEGASRILARVLEKLG